jgi:hypothetical protein
VTRTVTLTMATGMLALAGCTSDVAVATAQRCAPLTPRELPSGAAVGEPVATVGPDGITRTTWGTGSDAVIVESFFFRIPGAPLPSFEPVEATPPRWTVRGQAAGILDVGSDGPDPQVGFSWHDDTCAWTVYLGPGNTRDDAIDYAGRY